MKIFFFISLLVTFSLLIWSCNKDDDLPYTGDGTQYESQLVKKSGWKTIAFDEANHATFARSGKIHLGYQEGEVYKGLPLFWAIYQASGVDVLSSNFHYQASGLMKSEPTNGVAGSFYFDYSELDRESGGGLPPNLKDAVNPDYYWSATGTVEIYEGKPLTKTLLYHRTFSSSQYQKSSVLGLKYGEFSNLQNYYGWFSDLSKRTILEKKQLWFIEQQKTIGVNADEFCFTEVNGKKTTVQFSVFYTRETETSENKWYGCLAAKSLNLSKDSIDFITDLVEFPITDINFEITTRIDELNNSFLTSTENIGTGVVNLFIGDLDNGLSKIYTSKSGCTIQKLFAGMEAFYVLLEENGKKKALKIKTDGNVVDLGNPSFDHNSTFSHYKGDLVIGRTGSNGKIIVEKISANGTDVLGKSGINVDYSKSAVGSARIAFASDGDNLYGAIKNDVSPINEIQKDRDPSALISGPLTTEVIKFEN